MLLLSLPSDLASWRNIAIALIDAVFGEQKAQTYAIAFHEKAGRSQVDSRLASLNNVFSPAEVPAIAVSQIQSDGQFLLGNIPALLRHGGANLLYCRSPFISCASEHVDNLGAYTASRPETGLLIPSGFDS